ncbi:MAG TPA: FtsX-like permease family protein [Streptosporangiaceae bacterium]|nr:FtsX-like permease family protein [Streptosporangiaceae bacterium]
MKATAGSPAVTAARTGLTGRRVQAIVIGLVLLVSTAASTLALGLLVDSNAPFDHAFARQRGAHVTAAVNAAQASAARLAATTRLSGVTAASGPFPETTVTAQVTFTASAGPGNVGVFSGPLDFVGRAAPGGPVDDLTLTAGRWARRAGEVVWSGSGSGPSVSVGAQVTVSGVPGSPRLKVVGVATSATGTAQAWVTPAELAALRAPGTPDVAQMLYRFSGAGTSAAVSADIARLRAALPPGSLLGAQSYLTTKLQATRSIAPWVPFIVAFGLIGLVMAVLIVANVVSGAVVAGTRRIGVLKSVGFSPAQVVPAYVLEVAIPAAAGALTGVLAGNLLSLPLLSQTARVYGVGALAVPPWVDVAMPLAMLGLTVAAALPPALRAGRLSPVQAIATGRAPRAARGYGAHRLLGKARRLPRPLTLGLAAPFARPARTLVTLVAILLGGTVVTFAAGLATSLDRVATDLSRAQAEPVQVGLPGQEAMVRPADAPPLPSPAAQQRAVRAALRAQPGTLRYVAEADDDISVPGLPDHLSLTGFGGDAAWTGYQLITGHWYRGSDQVVVNTGFLTDTGAHVGDDYTITSGSRHVTVRITGEIFEPHGGTPAILAGLPTLSVLDPSLTVDQYDVALRPGTAAASYANTLATALGPEYSVSALNSTPTGFAAVIGLIATLTLLLAAVAGLGVLNTVVLQTRERVHDLGVFKAVGMTPRQVTAMVVCSMAGIGLVAGLVAIPAGVALQRYVLPVMAHAAQTGVPASVLDVYVPAELVLLALSGLVIAVAGALAPAGWAARVRTASALRAE